MNTPPVPWDANAPHLNKTARRVAMEAQAATKETTINSQCIATTNQIQSTTGVETLDVKNPLDPSQRHENLTCTDIALPHTDNTVQTAHMNSSGPVVESDMESVDISSDDKSDDGWSVISNGSDFVVVDSDETTDHSANANKSKRRSKLPKRISKLQARLRTLNTVQQNTMACQNEQGEPDGKTEVNRSSQEGDGNKQRLAGPKDKRNVIDELIERLTEQARALKL
ncbi:hypothetical protein KCU89_g2054, partial [Aureobasidium melanogenum]